MNATEQRRQATVAQRVEQHVSDVTEVLDRFDARLFEFASKGQETRRELNELKPLISRLAGVLEESAEQFTEIDQRLSGLRDRYYLLESVQQAFHGRTFWSRLFWLFTGR